MSDPLNQPPGYGQPQQPAQPYPQPHSQMPHSANYPAPQGFRGATRQIFNPASYKQPGSGSWAAASLILAIIGWVTFGCLGIITWPLGLIFGFLGLLGNKRGKGLAFAGFLLSGLGITGIVGFMVIGGMGVIQAENNADQAGAPVVAAIEQFKEDHKRVPHTLQELVDEGYLPPAWNDNFGEMGEDVQNVVKGQDWSKFLAYQPGENSEWEPGISWEPDTEKSVDEFGIEVAKPESKSAEKQSYGLAFIGLDSKWGGYDDSAVEQNPEDKFDLTSITNGDSALRELNRTRIEMSNRLKQLKQRKVQLVKSLMSVNKALVEHDKTLHRLTGEGGFTTIEEIRADKVTSKALKLIGETKKRQVLTKAKLLSITGQIESIGIEVARLKNQEEMAKLGDSAELAAELEQLLSESKKALDDDSYFDDTSDDKYAEEWFSKNYK